MVLSISSEERRTRAPTPTEHKLSDLEELPLTDLSSVTEAEAMLAEGVMSGHMFLGFLGSVTSSLNSETELEVTLAGGVVYGQLRCCDFPIPRSAQFG